MAEHNELGTWGETLAAEYLEKKGYQILERDWKSGHRDLDIIAMDGDTMVIVEVKTRRNRLFTDPEMAAKVQKLLDWLDDYDDTQEVYHDAELPEEEEEE